MACKISQEAIMPLFGQMPDSPLRTACRIFGAVIVSLALLVGILAGMRSTTQLRPSVTPNALVSLHIEDRGFSEGAVERSVGLHT
jgi:hypothetical protein